MDRRTLIKALSYGTLSVAGGHLGWRLASSRPDEPTLPDLPLAPELQRVEPTADEGGAVEEPTVVDRVDDPAYLQKIRDFDRSFEDDVILEGDRLALLQSTARRLTKAQRVIGHGHFNLVSFDDLIRYGRRYRSIGAFTREQLDFIDEIFHAEATDYGFYGDKVLTEMTTEIAERECVKVSGTGHYLFRGEAHEKYVQMRKDLDNNIFLTSGIRNVVKQTQLFIDKAVTTEGNLSQASRSLAPPGYSYHAVGDFDIGKVGAGLDNFTEVFAETDEYKKLVDLGYMELRYTPTNPFGVRHEPWHIKMRA
ncbi:MAG: D-alanyl-D-alanine carboxypeptidase family protein [Acidobacteriota bacterium]